MTRIIPNTMFGLIPIEAVYGGPCKCGYGFLARHDSGLCEWCTAGLDPGRQYRSWKPKPWEPRPRPIVYSDEPAERDRDVEYPISPKRPNPAQCPNCWRAALHSDVKRYVHEIAPCFPGCHQTTVGDAGGQKKEK